MNSINATRNIEGASFQFVGEPANGDIRVRCVAQDEGYLPLCNVVETAWRYSPARLLKAVGEQHGQSFEGEVSFAYSHDYPDELEPGVTVDYLGEELVVSEEMFRRLVVALADFYLQAKRELQPGSAADEAALPPLLAALRR
jgi:hypothetical protein